ncbi:MAG: DUF222 domain-containing protein [Acidimicrobiales bacterium]
MTDELEDLDDLTGLSAEGLESRICGFAARLAADECAWLQLVGEFDRRRGFDRWDCRSTSHWLSWHCGLSLRAGRERVRVARALHRFPTVRAEFAAGRLAYSKVRAVTRVATAATEQTLVELALAATAAQTDRICSAYARTDRGGADLDIDADDREPDDHPDPIELERREAAHAEARAERAGVRTWHDEDGLFHLEAVLAPEDGAQIEAALASAIEHVRAASAGARVEGQLEDDAATANGPAGPLPGAGPTSSSSSASPPWSRVSRLGGLIEVARAYLSGPSVSPSVERRHLLAVVDVGVVTRHGELGVDESGRCTLNGQRLTPEMARRLGASAPLTTILVDHRGRPLSVGRTSRDATAAQRLALHIRDGGSCRHPGCHHAAVDAHHIVYWEHGGPTDLPNLVLLCGFHHRLVHSDDRPLALDPDTGEVRVWRTDGTEVTVLDADPDDAPPRPEVDDDALQPGEEGTRLDLDIIIGGLAWLDDTDDTDDTNDTDESAA